MPVDHREIAFEAAISKIRKYRSALIPAAVTGKIHARDDVVPAPSTDRAGSYCDADHSDSHCSGVK